MACEMISNTSLLGDPMKAGLQIHSHPLARGLIVYYVVRQAVVAYEITLPDIKRQPRISSFGEERYSP